MQNFVANSAGRLLRSAHASKQPDPTKSKAFCAYPPNDLEVQHNVAEKKFSICLGEDCAVILYNRSNNVLDLYHTEVPIIFRGQGVAARLAKETFEYIHKKNLKMKLSCEYLQKYYKENETLELRNLLV